MALNDSPTLIPIESKILFRPQSQPAYDVAATKQQRMLYC